jgi:hypothetical protein
MQIHPSLFRYSRTTFLFSVTLIRYAHKGVLCTQRCSPKTKWGALYQVITYNYL